MRVWCAARRVMPLPFTNGNAFSLPIGTCFGPRVRSDAPPHLSLPLWPIVDTQLVWHSRVSRTRNNQWHAPPQCIQGLRSDAARCSSTRRSSRPTRSWYAVLLLFSLCPHCLLRRVFVCMCIKWTREKNPKTWKGYRTRLFVASPLPQHGPSCPSAARRPHVHLRRQVSELPAVARPSAGTPHKRVQVRAMPSRLGDRL
jgi:hypothetical protein